MRDISLHLLDLAQNSIKAGATLVEMTVAIDETGIMTFALCDNGCGMDENMTNNVQNPFVTSRTERKVGLGIPLFAQNARLSGGDVQIMSQPNIGTTLIATFDSKQIDCLPTGDLAQTVYSLVVMNPEAPDFLIICKTPKGAMTFDTREIRNAVGGLALNEPEIAAWIHEALNEELIPILEGY